MGPLLFLLYVNDLPNVSNKLSKILFADDTSVFYSHKNPEILIKVVNEELDKLSTWFKSNKLSLNIKKTSYILFGTKSDSLNSSMKIQIDDISINNVRSARFLGVILDDSLSWKPHISATSTKIAKVVGILGKIRHLINKKVSVMLYYSMLYPYINYCNVAWASTHPTKLESIFRLQKRALRIIFCVNRRHPSQSLFTQASILTVYQVNQLQIALFVYSSIKKLFPQHLCNIFIFNNEFHQYPTRSGCLIRPPYSRTTQTQFSVLYRGSKVWNSLPTSLIEVSKEQFKQRVKLLLLSCLNFPYGFVF